MAEKTFKLEIVTPARTALSKEVVSVVLPGKDGVFGVLANHAPLMAEMSIGEIRIRDAEGKITRMATSGGFVEVRNNVVRILAETAERPEDIDLRRAEEAKERAEARIRSRKSDLDMVRAEAALKRAMVRIRIAKDRD